MLDEDDGQVVVSEKGKQLSGLNGCLGGAVEGHGATREILPLDVDEQESGLHWSDPEYTTPVVTHQLTLHRPVIPPSTFLPCEGRFSAKAGIHLFISPIYDVPLLWLPAGCARRAFEGGDLVEARLVAPALIGRVQPGDDAVERDLLSRRPTTKR